VDMPPETEQAVGRSMFWSTCLVTLLCAWLATSPFLWPTTRLGAFLTAASAIVAWVFSLLALARPRYRWGVAVLGVLIGMSGMAFYGAAPAVTNHVICGVLLVVFALFPRRQPEPAAHPHASEALRLFPLSFDETRFLHGLGWGAVATIVMGAVTLLAVAVHVWPMPAPLAVVAARHLSGTTAGVPWPALLLGVVELAYGALCGGLLTTLADPVDLGHALAIGALRWMTTQVVVLPALGWADFGLARGPALMLATALPHLAYAVALGLLLRRDDQRLSHAHPTPSPVS
jgi:hypothetical protein